MLIFRRMTTANSNTCSCVVHSYTNTTFTQCALFSESIRFSTKIAGTACANSIILAKANITKMCNRIESAYGPNAELP